MAERQGFEPWRRFPAYTLSRRAPSTTRPPLRWTRFCRVTLNIATRQEVARLSGGKPARPCPAEPIRQAHWGGPSKGSRMTAPRAHFNSALDTRMNADGYVLELWRVELRNLNRGFCGALLVALPLLYTMEISNKARRCPRRLAPAWRSRNWADVAPPTARRHAAERGRRDQLHHRPYRSRRDYRSDPDAGTGSQPGRASPVGVLAPLNAAPRACATGR